MTERAIIVFGSLALLGACGGGASPYLTPPPAGQKCGPVNTGVQPQNGANCGAWGVYVMEEGRCQGKANACCSYPADCYSDECIDGVCSSTSLRCARDSDCTMGAVCAGDGSTCIKLPGAPCTMESECSARTCSAEGVCPCAEASSSSGPVCRSTADCCSGACVSGQCLRAKEGGPCATEADCVQGICTAGACRCLPNGTPIPTPMDVGNLYCCSSSASLGVCGP